MIDGAKHLDLALLKLCHVWQLPALFLCVGHGTQLKAHLAQFPLEQHIDVAGIVGLIVVGHHVVGNYAVLLHKISATAECSSVGKGILEEPIDHTVVIGLLTRVDDTLQEEVGLLKLVVEEEIGSRQLKPFEVVLVDGFASKYIHRGEEPATARRSLVGDTLVRDAISEMIVHGTEGRCIGGKNRNAGAGQCISYQLVLWLHGLLQLLHNLGCDGYLRLNFERQGGERCKKSSSQENSLFHTLDIIKKVCRN